MLEFLGLCLKRQLEISRLVILSALFVYLFIKGKLHIKCAMSVLCILKFHGLLLKFLSFLLYRCESSPALQTSSMLDCLAIIQTIISFLQKSSSEQNVCNLFDRLALSCIQTKNNGGEHWFGISYQTTYETVQPWKDLMILILTDLCDVLFDGM